MPFWMVVFSEPLVFLGLTLGGELRSLGKIDRRYSLLVFVILIVVNPCNRGAQTTDMAEGPGVT